MLKPYRLRTPNTSGQRIADHMCVVMERTPNSWQNECRVRAMKDFQKALFHGMLGHSLLRRNCGPWLKRLWEPILRLLCSFSLPIKFPLENDYFQVRKHWPFLEVVVVVRGVGRGLPELSGVECRYSLALTLSIAVLNSSQNCLAPLMSVVVGT